MKNTTTHQVVMLPTKKADDEVYSGSMYMEKEKLYGRYDINYNIRLATPYHLHITREEEIKVGAIRLLNGLFIQGDGESTKIIGSIVIASTDDEITPNSWIPESFTLAYIKAHGEGKPITEVELQMEKWSHAPHFKDLDKPDWYQIMTRPDGSVVIHQAKTYTKEQMMNAIAFGRNLGMAHPEVNEEQAKIRQKEIQEFIDSDFKF
jgi:hypothetical protein